MASPLANAIRANVSIVDVVSNYVQLTRSGEEFRGLSPFTQEKTPSFFVSPTKNVFYCFSTKKGGDVISFVMEVEKIDYRESLRFLAQKFGIEVSEGDTREYQSYSELVEFYKRLTKTFQHFLLRDPMGGRARAYLKERGLTEKSLEAFQLGYAPGNTNTLIDFLSKRGFSNDFLFSAGMLNKHRQSFFRNRIMFPLVNQMHEYLGFGGRSLDEFGPKYLHSRESMVFKKKKYLYGFAMAREAIKSKDKVYIAEGYFDVIACHQVGIKNVVASLGTSLGNDTIEILLPYTKNIVLLFDSDRAGVGAAIRAMNASIEHGVELQGVLLPQGADPADIIQASRKAELLEILEDEQDIFELLLAYNTKKHENAYGALHKEVFSLIYSIESQVRREDCLAKFAVLLDKKVESVQYDFSRYTSGQRGVKRDEVQSSELAVDMELLHSATDRRCFARLREDVSADDYRNKESKGLFYILEETFRETPSDEKDFVIAVQKKIENNSIRDRIMRMLVKPYDFEKKMLDIEGGIQKIRKERYIKEKEKLIKMVATVSKTESSAEYQRIWAEITELTKTIDQLNKGSKRTVIHSSLNTE